MNLALKLTSLSLLVLCACGSNSDGANSSGASNTGGSGLTGGSSNGGGSAQGGTTNGGASNGGVTNGGATNGGASNSKDGGASSGDSCANADGSAGNTPGSCCAASTVPGCNDSAVQDCVCKQDPRCCSEKWNDVCVALVNGLACGKTCPTNDCCTTSTSGGCSDQKVQDCVCGKSPECCTQAWNDVCVLLINKNILGGTCGAACN